MGGTCNAAGDLGVVPSLGSIGNGPASSSGLATHTISELLHNITGKSTPAAVAAVGIVMAGIVTGGAVTVGIVTGGTVIVGTVTGGTVIVGIVTGGAVIVGTVTGGAVIVGIVTNGMVTGGNVTVGGRAVVVVVVVGCRIGAGTPCTITILVGEGFDGSRPKHAVKSHRHMRSVYATVRY